MIHINTGAGKHEWLTDEQLKERNPAAHAAIHEPTPYKEYGAKMAKIRKAADMSIMELAKACGWKLAFTSGIETGRIKPTGEQVDLYQIKINEYRAQHPERERGRCTCGQNVDRLG